MRNHLRAIGTSRSCFPPREHLRVIDMATGTVVSERQYDGTSVRWIAADLLLCGRAPRRRIEIELVRASSPDVLVTSGADRRNENIGSVELGVTSDGTRGYLVSHLRDGAFGWTGDFARIAISRDEESRSVELEIVAVDLRLRAAGMGRSTQTHTRRQLESQSAWAPVAAFPRSP
jgi:hypothetical protein